MVQEVTTTLGTTSAFLIGYLVGAVPIGLLVPKALYGLDVRRCGTGNTGAANVHESVGALPAAIVALGIFLQGLLPPLAARLLGASEAAVAASAVGTVVGYGWPVFLGFKGGRVLGTGTGAGAALSPGGFVVLLALYALGAVLRQTSLGALLAFVAYAAYVFYSTGSVPLRVAAVLLLAVVVARRLEGLREDLQHGPPAPTLLNLLLFQRHPQRSDREKHEG